MFFQHFGDDGKLNGVYPRITGEDTVKSFAQRSSGLSILLIHVPIREWSYPNIFPIGHGYVASVAIMDGHTVTALDLNAERLEPVSDNKLSYELMERRIPEVIQEVCPDLIGFGGIITQYGIIKQGVRICREVVPNTPIVLGGGIGSSMPEFMVRNLGVDIVVQEEGEATFSELTNRVENKQPLTNLKGIVFRDGTNIINNGLRKSIAGGTEGLDGVPWPARHLWPINEVYSLNPVGHLNWESKWADGKATSSRLSLSLVGSRGCPYAKSACDYCYASYLGEKYRLRSPVDVANEMYYLYDRYGTTYLHFLDDLFLTSWRWVLEFCDELEKKSTQTGVLIEWGATCRTNIVADDVQRAIKQGRDNLIVRGRQVGLRHIGFGVESASPTILKSIDKSGQTIAKMEVAIQEVQEVLGYADCSFMVGSPGESASTVKETVDFCKKVGLRPEVFFYTTAYPGTKFWDLALQKGLITKAVTGMKGPADETMIERYLLKLGEQGSHVRTNFSDIPDDEVLDLAKWAVYELNPTETKFKREPHSGDKQTVVVDASRANL